MNFSKLIKDRFFITSLVFCFVAGIFIYRLADLQLINGAQYAKSKNQLLASWTIPAPRGKVMDRNGVLIAENREGYNIQISKAGLDNKQLNRSLYKLIKIFEKNNNPYLQSFNKIISNAPLNYGTQSIRRASLSTFNRIADSLPRTMKLEDGYDDVITLSDLYNFVSKKRSSYKNITINANDFKYTSKDLINALTSTLKREIILKKPDDLDSLSNIKQVYEYLRDTVYQIDKSYSAEDTYKIMTLRYEIRQWSKTKPIPIANDVSKRTVLEIEERQDEFLGVTYYIQPVRKYNNPQYISHILGYVGRINEEELKNNEDKKYANNDLIGKMGVERDTEDILRGTDGTRVLEVNTNGRMTADVNSIPAIPGKDVQLTIDMRLQKVAYESLARRINEIKNRENNTAIESNYGDANAGAVVAMDTRTGEVLAMASYPSYNSDDFLNSSKSKQALANINKYFQDVKGSPMTNRAISGAYAPGSTFKALMGIAGIEEGLITPDTKIYDSGTMTIDNWELTCMEYRHGYGAHGWEDFSKALAASCNIFFHKLGVGWDGNPGLGIERIDKWATLYGLGRKTGLDIGGKEEKNGVLASKEFKANNKSLEYRKWVALDTALASIGQSFNAFTPIQLANYTCCLANGGKRYTPHLIKDILSPEGSIVKENNPKPYNIPVSQSTVLAVKQGMLDVTDSVEGTAANLFNGLPHKVAAKTGTAQTQKGDTSSNNGVFISYYPAELKAQPEIAVAVVIEHGVQGRMTAPIAKEIFTEYEKIKRSASINGNAEPLQPSILP